MAGINTVSAVTAGYMADGGHINSTSNVILYQDANGTYELSDQSASKGKTDNSEAVGNVAAGNFSQAGSEANYESYNIQIYRETTNPWAGVTHNGKKYDWNGSVDLVKKGNDYYCDTGAKDGEGNVLYAKFDFATMAPNPDHAGWKSGKDLGFSGGITNNVAVGNHAVTKSSSSVAIGDNSSSQGYRSVAVGADSQAGDTTDTADHNDGISAVAVGDGATTNEVIGTSVVEIPGTNETYSNISGTEPVGTVSVGDKGKERTITNVAAGRIGPGSTDAVNGSELYAVSRQVGINVQNISDLNNRINKVGAGAAALAGLHPLDFDPDEKWDFAVGYGHYRGENAAAIGAFYRPNEDTMFNIAGTIGNGNDMVSAGLSIKVGQANHVSVSRVAMAKEIIELRKALEDQRSFIADSVAGNVLDLSKIQLFPDTPENHWAYDYVATLAGNGILEGYPDGYFKGTRPMTRYEMAAVLYRAMLRGVRLKEKALREFAPELDRIRVDTITKHKDGSPDIQRVRTIKGRGC